MYRTILRSPAEGNFSCISTSKPHLFLTHILSELAKSMNQEGMKTPIKTEKFNSHNKKKSKQWVDTTYLNQK
jgi:hypothetical protein